MTAKITVRLTAIKIAKPWPICITQIQILRIQAVNISSRGICKILASNGLNWHQLPFSGPILWGPPLNHSGRSRGPSRRPRRPRRDRGCPGANPLRRVDPASRWIFVLGSIKWSPYGTLSSLSMFVSSVGNMEKHGLPINHSGLKTSSPSGISSISPPSPEVCKILWASFSLKKQTSKINSIKQIRPYTHFIYFPMIWRFQWGYPQSSSILDGDVP